jgi:spermidine/putrescine transport system permease protein
MQNRRAVTFLGILPVLFWLFTFLLVPLVFVLIDSFARRGTYGGMLFDQMDFRNYLRALDPLYAAIFFNSLKLAAATTLCCLFLGFPMAWLLAIAPKSWRNWLVLAVVVPFWTNFIVRVYAIKVLLSEQGPLQALISAMQLPLLSESITSGPWAVMLGMVTNYLPFLVLPLWVSIEKFDFTLLEAAKDLGASRLQSLRRILLPQIRSGLVSGMLFVFTPALGEFVIPDLLGGARTMLVGNLVTEQFLKARDWPFGAALSIVLITLVVVALTAGRRGASSRRAHKGVTR